MFFEWDRDMYDSKSNEAARAITSDLNEELGQVWHFLNSVIGNQSVLYLFKDRISFH